MCLECCYSFLFTLHWGKDFSSLAKCLVFFLVLPVGQFVPFLAWIESFEFKSVNKAFEMLNLHTKNNARDEEDLRAFEEAFFIPKAYFLIFSTVAFFSSYIGIGL